jgi:hypothetical protein
MSNGKLMGISLISFFASIAGIIVSFLLIREDVTSTAHTLFEYFPSQFGVIPSSTWTGAILLGVFTSILQVVAASVAFSKQFATPSRVMAFVSFIFACFFDNWTDVVFRSGNLMGNVRIATITTLAFYTFGSEITQGLSWLVFANNWRSAISDIMWGWAKVQAGFSSIKSEWANFQRAATNKENKDRGVENKPQPNNHQTKQNTQHKPIYTPVMPTQSSFSNSAYRPAPNPMPHTQPKPYPRESGYLKMLEGDEGN